MFPGDPGTESFVPLEDYEAIFNAECGSTNSLPDYYQDYNPEYQEYDQNYESNIPQDPISLCESKEGFTCKYAQDCDRKGKFKSIATFLKHCFGLKHRWRVNNMNQKYFIRLK